MFGEFYEFLMSISNIIWALLVPIMLLVGLLFTFRTSFTQIINLPDMFRALTKKEKDDDDSISGLQAFFVGLASRVGTGNIAGVATAILAGGPGSVFWMWIVALVGSASSFIESTLAQLYKVRDAETKYRGGPAYYISTGLKNKPLAIAFAVSISISFGMIFNAVQANTIALSFNIFFPENAQILEPIGNTSISILSVFIAIILAIFVGVILFKGTKTIARISSIIVPIMAVMYIGLVGVIVLANFSLIPELFGLIFSEALSAEALAGGLAGAVVQQGVKRGLFSNEAGMGSAPNAAAAADVKHPVTQGFIQSLGVYVDTLIICTATAFVILLPVLKDGSPELYTGIEDGIKITQTALFDTLGIFAVYFLTIAIFFFAFSSILGNYFYSESNIEFLSTNKNVLGAYKFLVIFMVVFGSLASSTVIWNLADLFMGIMALINLYAIVALHDKAILLLKDFKKQRKAGNEPKFNANDYSEFKDFEIWQQ